MKKGQMNIQEYTEASKHGSMAIQPNARLLRLAAKQVETPAVPSIVHEALRSSGQPLGREIRALFESRFGHDFGHVKTHTDAKAEESARAVNASAYAIGCDIVLGKEASLATGADQRKLLAHELIHVAQQDRGPCQPTAFANEQAEREAVEGSHQASASQAIRINTTVGKGSLQRQKKEETSGGIAIERGFEEKPHETEKKNTLNKFSFTADVTSPLVPGLRLGPAFFLEKLKLETRGSSESAEPLSLGETQISSLQTKLALDLARLEMGKLKLPANLGTLSLGTKLGASASTAFALGEDFQFKKGSLATTASLEGGYATPSLLSPRLGELSLSAKLRATGSLTGSFGEESKFLPKVTGEAGLESSYQSPYYRSPYLTLGGVMGEKARFSAGAETGFGVEYGSEKGLGSKLSAGGFLGISGMREKGPETFIKLKVTGEVDLDLQQGKINSKSESLFLGFTAGAKF
jgi:hypothetical protein